MARKIKHKLEDYIGKRYSRLVVVGEGYTLTDSGTKIRKFRCLCDCGNETFATPSALRSMGTRSCGCLQTDHINQNIRKTQEQFIEKSKARYPGLFEYGKVVYTRCDERVILTCKTHNKDFEITPQQHLQIKSRGGCSECKKIRVSEARSKDTLWFIEKALEKHGDRYLYDKTVYTGIHNKLIVACKTHGNDFLVSAKYHLYDGKGCPLCSRGGGGFKSNKPACLYILEIEGAEFTFTGFGITSHTNRRLPNHNRVLKDFGLHVAKEYFIFKEDGDLIQQTETALKRMFGRNERTKDISGFKTESCFKPFEEVCSLANQLMKEIEGEKYGCN